MDDKKQQKRRSVSAARLYWAITDACELYGLKSGMPAPGDGDLATVSELLDALKDDNMESSR